MDLGARKARVRGSASATRLGNLATCPRDSWIFTPFSALQTFITLGCRTHVVRTLPQP